MSIRHTIHDNEQCRLVVEVDVGMVTLSLFFGGPHRYDSTTWSTGTGFSSHASVHLSPSDARDRLTLFRAIDGLELIVAGKLMQPERRVQLDALHRSIVDVTRSPTA